MYVQRTQFQKWKALFFTAFSISFGLYSYQDLATLHYDFEIAYQDSISDYPIFYSQLYSLSLFITAFLIPFIGILCDRFGAEVNLFAQQFLKTIFLFLQVVSLRFNHNPTLLFISRLGYNVATQNAGVMGAAHVASLFDQHELGLPASALGMISVLGTGSNMYYAPVINREHGLLINIFLSFSLNLIAMILVSVNLWDAYVIEKENLNIHRYYTEQNENIMKYKKGKTKELSDSMQEIPLDDFVIPEQEASIASSRISNKQQFSEIFFKFKNYNQNFWMVCAVLCISQLIYNMIDMLGNIYVQYQWNISPAESSQMESIFPLMSLFLPIMGKIVDKFSNQIDYFLIICLFLAQVSMIFLTMINPADAFIIFGITNVLRLACMLPVISLTLGQSSLGLPVAIVKSSADICAFLMGLIAGEINKIYGSYTLLFFMCLFLGFIGFILAIVISIRLRKKQIQIEGIRIA